MRNLFRVVVLAVGVASFGCKKAPPPDSGSNAGAPPAKVTLALNWVAEPEFGGFYAGRDGGAYQRRGLDVAILGGGAGVPVLQMVATGRADFGTVGGDELVIGRARGADVVAVYATYQTHPQGLMVHQSRKIERIDQIFRSGTLAVETGLSYVGYLKRKFDWSGVKVVPYDGGVAHFLNDPMFAQQCYVTSEPLAARRQGGDPQVFLIADTGFNPYATVVITRRALWRENPALVTNFVRASAEGWRAYLDAPQATNATLARLNPAMDAASMTEAAVAQGPLIETAATKQAGLGTMERSRWETLARQLVELGVVDKAPATDELFVNVAQR